MNRFKKIIASFVAVISILAFNVTGAGAEWKASGTKWWYSQGSSYATGWTQIDGQWYYFDSNGYMVTGWMQYGNSWYYFYDNGMMAHDCYIGSYYLNSNGEWTTHTSSYTGGSSYSSVSGSSQNKNKTAYLSATGKNIIQYQTAEEWILARPQLLQLKKQKQEVMDVAASAGNIFS